MLESLAPLIRRLARLRLKDAGYFVDADDLQQEGMIAAWQSIEAGRGRFDEAALRSHAVRRARWAMQDFVRRDSGWRAGLACSHRQAALAVVAAEWYADDPQTPESLALWREAARKTYAALQGLSAKHQQVLAMTADDAPLHQIAEACGMASPQLACKHRQAAIKRLREAVGEAA